MKGLFCGASGYGNLGDDSYRHLFSKYLPEVECYFDSPKPDSRFFEDIDFMVIGGGGLIYINDTPHFDFMSTYMEAAISLNIPLFFISCGIQARQRTDADIAQKISPWKKYLDYAEAISVRSPRCLKIISGLSETPCHYFPDLVYLLEPSNYHITPPIKYGLVIPHKGNVPRLYEKAMKNWENVFVIAMSRDDYDLVASLSSKFKCEPRKHLTPQEAARAILDSQEVVTSRYHGLVLSHKFNKDVYVIGSSYKLKSELLPLNYQEAINHVSLLRRHLGLN